MNNAPLKFIILAKTIAEIFSKDPSTKVGCVITGEGNEILTTGYNGFPRGVTDSEDRFEDRATKYKFTCHAEANAIYNAARTGAMLDGSTAYITFPPCGECSKVMAQAGIRTVYIDAECLSTPRAEVWLKDWDFVKTIFSETGIVYSFINRYGEKCDIPNLL